VDDSPAGRFELERATLDLHDVERLDFRHACGKAEGVGGACGIVRRHRSGSGVDRSIDSIGNSTHAGGDQAGWKRA